MTTKQGLAIPASTLAEFSCLTGTQQVWRVRLTTRSKRTSPVGQLDLVCSPRQ